MNISENPSLLEQLAASYAIGTLRGGARRRFETLARNDTSIRAVSFVWQGRMASLVELQAGAVPDSAVWKRIENLVQAEKQASAMKAQRSSSTAVADEPRSWWASLGLWRGTAAAGVMASVVVLFAASNLSQLNTQLRGQVSELSAKLRATPEIQYVAVLNDDKSAASMLVTFDPKNKRLLIKRVGGFQAEADKSLQLWALPANGGPRSLGVLGSEPVIRLTAASGDVQEIPTLAISLEPLGGAPAGGGPTGPVLLKGALIETSL